MTRIFLSLAVLDGLFLLASYLLGVVSKLQDGIHTGAQIYWVHFIVGLTTALINLMVHCLIFTYFLGTGRWVKEVKLAYELPDEPWPRLTRELKRRVFPPALFAMLFAIATGAGGAAAHVQLWPWLVHASLASITLAVNFWAFTIEYKCLKTNAAVLDGVLIDVDRIRLEHGLSSNAEALEEDARATSAPPNSA
jgi:hypothetical protein